MVCKLYLNKVITQNVLIQTVKHLPAMQETQVQSLGPEDPLENMATHSGILAWEIPWTEEPGRLPSVGLQRTGHNLATKPLLLLKHEQRARHSAGYFAYIICCFQHNPVKVDAVVV